MIQRIFREKIIKYFKNLLVILALAHHYIYASVNLNDGLRITITLKHTNTITKDSL